MSKVDINGEIREMTEYEEETFMGESRGEEVNDTDVQEE